MIIGFSGAPAGARRGRIEREVDNANAKRRPMGSTRWCRRPQGSRH